MMHPGNHKHVHSLQANGRVSPGESGTVIRDGEFA